MRPGLVPAISTSAHTRHGPSGPIVPTERTSLKTVVLVLHPSTRDFTQSLWVYLVATASQSMLMVVATA